MLRTRRFIDVGQVVWERLSRQNEAKMWHDLGNDRARQAGDAHMPKQITGGELEAIVDVVAGLPDGGSVDAVRGALNLGISRRTLQRRLAALVSEGRLVRTGGGPGTRYLVPDVQATPPGQSADVGAPASVDYHLPLSSEGASISRAVRAPIQKRTPVGYRREFLDDYRPGETWYLSAELRGRLLALGDSPDRERPAGTYARKIHERLLIDLSWNSSRLEGNTYSLLDTQRLLEHGEAAVDNDARETQMILNHKAAIDLLVMRTDHVGFNRYTVLNLHALLAENLLADSRAWGALRSAGVDIGGPTYHPLEVPQLIEGCFQQILDKADAIPDPFEQAFFVLVQLPYLQPFLDMNKRVSRLAANLPLIRVNLCPLSFVDVPTRAYVDGLLGVHELNRVELLRDVFCWAYERSCARYSVIRQPLGEPDPTRLRHRGHIAETIRSVVSRRMDRSAAVAHIRRRASDALPTEDRSRFIELVETDLMNLHEGNLARARLSPAEYSAWRAGWR